MVDAYYSSLSDQLCPFLSPLILNHLEQWHGGYSPRFQVNDLTTGLAAAVVGILLFSIALPFQFKRSYFPSSCERTKKN